MDIILQFLYFAAFTRKVLLVGCGHLMLSKLFYVFIVVMLCLKVSWFVFM